MQQDIGEFHISVNHVQLPNLNQTLDHLSQDQAHFSLAESFPNLEEDGKVATVAILHHHVDVGSRLDSLVEADGVGTLDEVVESNFFLDAVHVLLRDRNNFDYFTGISFINLLFLLFMFLCFTHLSILTNAKHFLNVDKIVSHFSDERLAGLSLFFFAWSSAL